MKIAWLRRKQTDVHGDVHDFHQRFNFPHPSRPAWPNKKTIDHRLKRIREEADELIEAIESPKRNLVKIAREAIDLAYVAIGVFVDFGLPFWPCWKAVQDANMDKMINPKGGKPLKHDDWVAPDDRIENAIVNKLFQRE